MVLVLGRANVKPDRPKPNGAGWVILSLVLVLRSAINNGGFGIEAAVIQVPNRDDDVKVFGIP